MPLPTPPSPGYWAHLMLPAQGWQGGWGPGVLWQQEGVKGGWPRRCWAQGCWCNGLAALPSTLNPHPPALLAYLLSTAEKPLLVPQTPAFFSPTDRTLNIQGVIHMPENSPFKAHKVGSFEYIHRVVWS